MLVSVGCASASPPEARYSWEFYGAPKVSPETFTARSVAILPTVSIEYDPTQEIYRETLTGFLYTALKKYPSGPRILPLAVVRAESTETRSGVISCSCTASIK
jgi:hypothetical protein